MERGRNEKDMSNRLRLIDTIRGITILSMIGFHTCWDLCYFGMGISEELLYGNKFYIWQQSICWTFILIAGYSFSLGHHHLKRGLMALGGGIIITLVTYFVVPDALDCFGVLWMTGSSILLMIPIDRLLCGREKLDNYLFFLLAAALFVITKDINYGYLGFEGHEIVALPSRLYSGHFMTYLGFMDPGFYSSDYFSLIPWFFLFTAGYFLNKMLKETFFEKKVLTIGFKPLEFIGRHSLIIYMLHQVVIYGVLYIVSIL